MLLSDFASCTGLVLGERLRALIGFVWPARNGTESDTAAAGSDGLGSVLEPVPKLFDFPSAAPASAFFLLPILSPSCPDLRSRFLL